MLIIMECINKKLVAVVTIDMCIKLLLILSERKEGFNWLVEHVTVFRCLVMLSLSM